MKSILEELWYGNICPETDSRSTTSEMKQLMEYMARHHETLLNTLNDEQKETFEKFDDCWSEYAICSPNIQSMFKKTMTILCNTSLFSFAGNNPFKGRKNLILLNIKRKHGILLKCFTSLNQLGLMKMKKN